MNKQQPVRKQVTQADVLELFDYRNGDLFWRASHGQASAGAEQ